jgi:hypothetical protein
MIDVVGIGRVGGDVRPAEDRGWDDFKALHDEALLRSDADEEAAWQAAFAAWNWLVQDGGV